MTRRGGLSFFGLLACLPFFLPIRPCVKETAVGAIGGRPKPERPLPIVFGGGRGALHLLQAARLAKLWFSHAGQSQSPSRT